MDCRLGAAVTTQQFIFSPEVRLMICVLIFLDVNHSHAVVIKRAVRHLERTVTSTFLSSIKFSATAMAVPPPPLQSLTPELKLTLKKSIESVLTQIIQTNSETVFFRESALLSAFRDRLSAPRISIPEPVTNANAGPFGAIHAQDLVQSFYETIPLSLYDAYQPFVARFFDKSPCPSSAVRDLLAPAYLILLLKHPGPRDRPSNLSQTIP
jgi:hypothetical protein